MPNINVSGWLQEEKNFLQAATVALLFQAGVTYDKISVANGVIDVLNPSGDISFLTELVLKTFIVAELEKIRIATEEALLEAKAREQELQANDFTDIKLAKVDAKIDSIHNLAELKTVLKKLVRFVIAGT